MRAVQLYCECDKGVHIDDASKAAIALAIQHGVLRVQFVHNGWIYLANATECKRTIQICKEEPT